MGMPTFDGRAEPDQVEHWIEQLEQKFDILIVWEEAKLKVVVAFLIVDALNGGCLEWWKGFAPIYQQRGELVTWNKFKEIILEQYFLATFRLDGQSVFRASSSSLYNNV